MLRLLACLALFAISPAGAASRLPVYEVITGGEQDYVVARGDTVWSITGRFTMSRSLFATLNGLADPDHLQPGTHLRVSDRHIVPMRRADGIVIDLTSRTLYWLEGGKVKARFPVAIGRGDWATPPGRYRIVGRRQDPEWRVPPSIQAEMRKHGEQVVSVVPPGPDNPLGKYWIQLSVPGYGLHGTNAPGSIGKYATHGCLRLLPEHIERLYREARDGTPVEVVHEPVKLARGPDRRVFLEVHRSVYQGPHATGSTLHDAIGAVGLGDAVDWARVDEVTERAWGVPEDVTRAATPTEPEEPLAVQ